MAPIAPKKRTSTRAKIARKPTITTATDANIDANAGPFSDASTFRTTKKDKRQIKHSVFLSKIEKPRSKTLKRRRPSKKLVANLDSLVDALPDTGNDDGNSDKRGETMVGQVNIIRQKSLKHKPGAMKRKETLDRRERERFARNLAQMAVASSSSSTAAADGGSSNNEPVEVTQAQPQPQTGNAPTSNRWAALRNFISQTMDQNPEFKIARST